MFAKVLSAAVKGIDACQIEVETNIYRGQPYLAVVGLPDAGVRESKERIRSAFFNSKYDYPVSNIIIINLAPADIKKEGSVYDLPIALGILACSDQVKQNRFSEYAIVGELALDSAVRPVRGALSMALKMRKDGLKGIILPLENASEAAVVEGFDVIPVARLSDAVGFLNGAINIEPCRANTTVLFSSGCDYGLDFSDVKGQLAAKRAITVAAAGAHNILMVGPPGAGKTMMARLVPTILPPLTLNEALETTKSYSICGLLSRNKPLITTRPFRAPHHTISDAGLVGGGSYPRPGEISLAHHGVLFLDELPEFNRNTLEVLRQPLEEGTVTIGRALASLTYPSEIMLVAAMNPCPCGYYGVPQKACSCTPKMIQNYHSKVSGPLLDRIDIHISVPAVPYKELKSGAVSENSEEIRNKISACRELQRMRFEGEGIMTNARMSVRQLKRHCVTEPGAEEMLRVAMEEMGFSARAYTRVLKIARTIADLDGAPVILRRHIAEAVQYRRLDRDGVFA